MKRIFSLFLLSILFSGAGFAQYAGRVYVDINQDCTYDAGDRALEGISVSDGLNVVKTDKNGKFTLPGHQKEKFIFITTPSGYKTLRHYIKITDTDAEYNFSLWPLGERILPDGSHRFVQITDTEIFNTVNDEDWVKNVKEYIHNESAAFVIHTGDICYEKGLKEHIQLMNTWNMNCPVFYCIGNHDLVKGEYGEKLFEEIYGPVFYSFEVGNVHYVVTPMLGGDHRPAYRRADVYRWLKNDLAQVEEGKSVVVFSHDLLTYGDKFHYGINQEEYVDLNKYGLKAWIYGHWHNNFMRRQGEVFTICTSSANMAGIDHSKAAFRVIHMGKAGEIKSELRYPYIDGILQIASVNDGKSPIYENGIPVFVNTYKTVSPTKEVVITCMVKNKPVFKGKMNRNTDWSWSIEIPAGAVKNKKQPVDALIKAYFEDGETIERKISFTPSKAGKLSVELGGDWNNLLENPAHTGPEDLKLKTPLQLAWVNNIGANIYMSSPLIYQGNIYVASVDENLIGEGGIYALEGKTGKLLWKYKVRNSIKNTIASGDGNIYAQDAEGYLYAVDALTGKLSWEIKLDVKGLPPLIEGVVYADGKIFAGAGLGLTAIEGKSGKVIWKNTSWKQNEGGTNTGTVKDTTLILGSQWGSLYANHTLTGELLWKTNKDGLGNRGASPAIYGDSLYIISKNSFFILDLKSGDVIRQKTFDISLDVTSTPCVTGDEIVFGTAHEGLLCLDAGTLDVKWEYKTDQALIYTSPYTRMPAATIETSPVVIGDIIYTGASDGNLYGIHRKSGELVWKHQTGAPIFSTIAVSGNTLILADFSGNVYAFR